MSVHSPEPDPLAPANTRRPFRCRKLWGFAALRLRRGLTLRRLWLSENVSRFCAPRVMKTLLLTVWFATLALTSYASAVAFSTVEFAGKRFTVCRVNVRKERLQLFHRDESGQPFKRFDRLAPWIESRGQKLVFAMNAGMYHADFSAVGLFVSDGQQ